METPATPETSPAPVAPRQTLAMRMAERRRLRAERAERLARLAPARIERTAEPVPEAAPEPALEPPAAPPGPPAAISVIGSERDAAAALEEFLRSLTQGLHGASPDAAPPLPGEVLPFHRPAPEAGAGLGGGSDLERLAGVGPGLVWVLRRAGIPDLASVAALEPEVLAARLGPLGRLVPARAWIEAARGDA